MMSKLGDTLVLASLLCSVAALFVGSAAAMRGSEAGTMWTRRLVVLFALLLIGANVVMEIALLTPDFSVAYVARVGSRQVPLWVRAVSLWSSLEGSILFWGAVLGAFTLGGVRTLRKHVAEEPWGLVVLSACGAFFALLISGPANPFGVASPVPLDGPGPNPLLQNHILMVVHPPILYIGYVGMVVPFALAVSALINGKLGPGMLASLRSTILLPWIFLTMGIVMGGWWAYEVLGWGGYWAWDPVENSPLLSWLTATAALHAALVAERRGVLRGWTVTLVLMTFLLTILGTFMTRSGVFNSVHAFAQSDIGPTFLVFLAIGLVVSIGLLATRLHLLGEASARMEGIASREGLIVVGNLILVVLMVTVLLGTVFPLITEAVKGVQISVGEPYFNRMAVPLGVTLLFLMGVGPALPWGAVTSKEAWRKIMPAAIAGAALLVVGLIAGGRNPWLLITLLFGGFSLEVAIDAIVRPVMQRIRSGRAVGEAMLAELGPGRRRFGAFTAHTGIIIVLIAVAVSSTGKLHTEVSLAIGETAKLGDYELTYKGARMLQEPHRQSLVATVGIRRKGVEAGILEPRMNYYFTQREPVGTPAVRPGFVEDLYLSAMNIDQEGGRLGLRAFVNPMVVWIWLGTAIIALGAFLAWLPRRVRSPVTTAAAAAPAPPAGLTPGLGN